MQNYRFGVAARLGLGYETLRKHNPKLIYASATGYGPEGPDRADPSFDQMGLARSGLMLAAGEPDMPPLQIAGGIADQMGAIMLAYGVLTALLARERFGVGQEVDASHLGSMIWLQGLSVAARLMMGFAIPRMPRKYASNPLWNHYRCGDGKWICLGMLQPDRYWADFVPRPRTAGAGHRRALRRPARARRQRRRRASRSSTRSSPPSRATSGSRILRAGGDFIFTIVNSVDELPNDPQVRANDYITDFDHPQFGKTQVVGMPRAPQRDARLGASARAGVRPAHRGDPHRAARLQLGAGWRR